MYRALGTNQSIIFHDWEINFEFIIYINIVEVTHMEFLTTTPLGIGNKKYKPIKS